MKRRMACNAETEACTSKKYASCDTERFECKSLVLWRRPLKTFKYSSLELFGILTDLCARLLDRRFMGTLMILAFIYKVPGPHATYLQICRQNIGFIIYWLGLGLLSSVGFGTGLHTFVLYLGPHIAGVTLAAYECQTLDFPIPPYPEQKICPDEPYTRKGPTTWEILSKVRPETLLWGMGTALGELPPYFMARSSRLSEQWLNDSREFKLTPQPYDNMSLFDKSKLLVERMVLHIGFFGIILCASVPNPLFDLVGLACGHFLVPFWKFFIATVIGKAILKSNIQQLTVIITFNEDLVNTLVNALGRLPYIGTQIQATLQGVIASTKQRIHRKTEHITFTNLNLVSFIFQLLSLVIVSYFLISLLNSLAQRRCNRLQQKITQPVQEGPCSVDRDSFSTTTLKASKIDKSIEEI